MLLNILSEDTTDPQTISNEFNNFFLSVASNLTSANCVKPNGFYESQWKGSFFQRQETNSMFLRPILEEDLIKIIKSLKNNTKPGLDGISSKFVKETYKKYITVLLYLVNKSFETGIFPEKLKEAVVIPIFKKGSKTECNNYRPISLLSSLSKIFEKAMKERLIEYLETINFFSSKQFGFRKGISTEIAINEFIEKVSIGINDGKKVSGLFLDISKAFDTVDHDILLQKMDNCGIRGVVNSLFESYLKNRKQCVSNNGINSDFGIIKYGVPQGSVLGATLFLVYINDLCNGNFNGHLTSFADDTALCYIADNRNDIRGQMKEDLCRLGWWFMKNNMVLSVEKTKYINFNLRGNDSLEESLMFKCPDCLCNEKECVSKCKEILEDECIKYLGVYVDKELNWKKHITNLKGKINSVLRIFYFIKHMCDEAILKMLYFSLVHCRLNYGIVTWGGTYVSNLKPLFIVQKKCIRVICKKPHDHPSFTLFSQLQILPLRNMFVFKVLRLFFIKCRNCNTCVDYKQKLRNSNDYPVPKPNVTYFTKTFSYLGPKLFNMLSISLRNVNCLYLFCKYVKKWLQGIEQVEQSFFTILH